MNYPIVRDQNGTVYAYLNNLSELRVKESINGEYTLSFTATIEALKTDVLYNDEYFIEYMNDYFRVITFGEIHDEGGILTVNCECEHISYDLLNHGFDNFIHTDATAASVMTAALFGTSFQYAGGDVTLKTNIQYTEPCNSKQLTIAIANNWNGELKYFQRQIFLYDRRGQDRGVDFRFGKNIKSIKRTIDRSKRDENGIPAITYEVDVAELKFIEGYEDLEYYELGDTIRVYDERLNVNVKVRIVEIEIDGIVGGVSSFVLGNPLDDIRGSLSGINGRIDEAIQDAADANQNADNIKDVLDQNSAYWDRIKDVTNDLGNVITGKLEGDLNSGVTKITNTPGTVIMDDIGILIMDQGDPNRASWAMRLSSTGWLIANGKNGDGSWNWRTAGTGEGIVADKVVAGAIDGLNINGVQITGSRVTGGTIEGVQINGSNITGGHITGGSLDIGQPTDSLYFKFLSHGRMMAYLKSRNESSGREDAALYFDTFGINNKQHFGMILRGPVKGDEETWIGTGVVHCSTGGLLLEGWSDSNPLTINFKSSYTDFYSKGLDIIGDFTVRGSKSAVVQTEHFGDRLLYADESDRCYFTTKGNAQTGENNKFIVQLDPIFLETIEPNSVFPYVIQATPYSDARVWVKAIYDKYVVFESDKPTAFSYVVNASRIGYKDEYLRESEHRQDRRERAAAKRERGQLQKTIMGDL